MALPRYSASPETRELNDAEVPSAYSPAPVATTASTGDTAARATTAAAQGAPVRIKVWDAPLRLFHGSLLLAVSAAIATGLLGGEWMTWHGRAGIAIVGLLAFRLSWGLIGSSTARFARFLPTPARVRAYVSGRWHGVGHNPLGALSVVALLGLLAAQVGTGLFSNDDIAFAGPLATLLQEEQVSKLTAWHHRLINVLYGLIGLHVAAIVFYTVFKRERLVPPMVTGWKDVHAVPQGAPQAPAHPARHGALALLLSVVIGVGAGWLASGAWIKADTPTAAPTTTPNSTTPAATTAPPAW